MTADDEGFAAIEHALKRSAAALRDADIPFLLGGSLASWARGGPETHHDLDLMIKPEDAERALQALVQAGLRPEDPPEEWLVKAWDGDVLVDLIFGPKGLPMTDEVIARGEELAVLGMDMRVMALEDVLTTFSQCADQVEWITLGSQRFQDEIGPTYGDTEKEITAVMPEFGASLTDTEIAQVAAFERHRFGGAEPETAERHRAAYRHG